MYNFSIIYFVYKMYLVKLVFNSFINPFTTKCRFCLQVEYSQFTKMAFEVVSRYRDPQPQVVENYSYFQARIWKRKQ